MAEEIRFYFDPLCPWCYQTSRWARRLAELGVVDVDWRVFSLAIVNGGDEGRAAADTGSAPSLRTAIAVRRAHGSAAVGAFYKAVSDALHQRGLPLDDTDQVDRLGIAISGRGAFRRFKDQLSRWPELLERWYAFSEDRQRGRARAWLAGEGYAPAPHQLQP